MPFNYFIRSIKNFGYQKTTHVFKDKDWAINRLKTARKEAGEMTWKWKGVINNIQTISISPIPLSTPRPGCATSIGHPQAHALGVNLTPQQHRAAGKPLWGGGPRAGSALPLTMAPAKIRAGVQKGRQGRASGQPCACTHGCSGRGRWWCSYSSPVGRGKPRDLPDPSGFMKAPTDDATSMCPQCSSAPQSPGKVRCPKLQE